MGGGEAKKTPRYSRGEGLICSYGRLQEKKNVFLVSMSISKSVGCWEKRQRWRQRLMEGDLGGVQWYRK